MEMETGCSIKDGWLVLEAGMLGDTEMTMRLVGGEGEQVEIYSPAGRQTVALSKLPINLWYYLKTLRDQTEGEQS
jgi:hypothetical protein